MRGDDKFTPIDSNKMDRVLRREHETSSGRQTGTIRPSSQEWPTPQLPNRRGQKREYQ